MATSLELQFIDESYQKLTQITGSVLSDGTGSAITNLNLTASNAVSASYAVTASYALNGNTSTVSASHALNADNAISSSYAVSASYALSASVEIIKEVSSSYADRAGEAISSSYAVSSSHALLADQSLLALDALQATYATSSGVAVTASLAIHSQTADLATVATSALTSLTATSSLSAVSSSHAVQANSALSASTSLLAITASFALNGNTTNTGSFITTASVSNATITYTKGDGSVFSNTVDNVVSASYAATASVLLGSIVSSSYAVSASHALNADSSISASHAVIADHSDTTDEVIVNVKNTSGIDLVKGVPVYATGVTGENINIASASNTSAATMPAIGVLGVDLSNNATGTAVVSGKIIGVNTNGFTAGKNIYVNSDGDFTQTKPTGSGLIQNIGVVGKVNASDGEILIQGAGRSNDLPNITENYVWLGDSNGVPQAVASSSLLVSSASTAISASHAIIADSSLTANTATSASFATSANTASFLPSTTRLNITDITASNATFSSASIGYLTTTSGSATIIGQQYIILNSDSPTARFAGIKVYDSGSGLTGSFEWDSVDDNWIQVETNGTSAGFLTGISGSKGSEAYPTLNTLLKGTGNQTTQNSSIVDNGVNVTTTLPISASGGIIGSLTGNASSATTAISASHAVQADSAITATSSTTTISSSHALNADNAISASHALQANNSSTATTATSASHAVQADSSLTAISATSASHAVQADSALTANSSTTSTTAATASYVAGANVDGTVASATSASYALTSSVVLEPGQGALKTGDLTFENSFAEVYGSEDVPLTAATITFSATSSPKIGASAVIFHSSSAAPTVVSGSYSISKESGVYDPQQLNIISFTYLGNSDFIQTTIGTTSGIITNNTDTYTTSPKVDHIVSLTQAEYNLISGSANVNTLYITL